MTFRAKTQSFALSFVALILSGGIAVAGPATDFLKSMDGKFRGRGKVILETSSQPERVSCRVENNFDGARQELVVSGVCATTRGKTNIHGKLTIINGKISGSFLTPFPNSEMTTSNSQFTNGIITLSASFVDKQSGALTRIRQIVSKTSEGGFRSVFQTYNNASKSYEEAGTMDFTRSDN